MNIPFGLVVHHLILLFLCFLIMMNRYLNRRGKNSTSVILNLLITMVIINTVLLFGITKAIISILLYLMYMIIMNKVAVYIREKLDKSNTLLDELEKKIKKK